jgi:diguanylate cyclase (GGDEF)-like protein
MAGTRRPSIKTSIRLTLFLTLLSVIVTGLVSHEVSRRGEANQAGDAGALAMAEALATQFQAGVPHSARDLQLACDRLVAHPSVLAVRLWDQSGAPVAGAAVADELLLQIDAPRQMDETDLRIEVVRAPSYSLPDGVAARLVQVDLGIHLRPERPARMAILLATDYSSRSAAGHLLAYCVPLMAVGTLVFLLGSRRLGQRVVRPIALLVDAVTAGQSGGETGPPTERRDELGELARAMQELHQDLHAWRRHAEQVERRMESQIAEKTRRITYDLKRIQREAWRDPLTGVNNRRMLDEKFPEILAAQRDARQELSVVMLDLDHFKILNDTLGHAAGDEVLAFAGELLRQCLRADDLAVRYGGDEFVLILPGLSARNSLTTANRIMTLFAQRAKMMARVSPAPTMSAGIASLWNNWPTTHVELLDLADKALYEAKQDGRAGARIYRPSHHSLGK